MQAFGAQVVRVVGRFHPARDVEVAVAIGRDVHADRGGGALADVGVLVAGLNPPDVTSMRQELRGHPGEQRCRERTRPASRWATASTATRWTPERADCARRSHRSRAAPDSAAPMTSTRCAHCVPYSGMSQKLTASAPSDGSHGVGRVYAPARVAGVSAACRRGGEREGEAQTPKDRTRDDDQRRRG